MNLARNIVMWFFLLGYCAKYSLDQEASDEKHCPWITTSNGKLFKLRLLDFTYKKAKKFNKNKNNIQELISILLILSGDVEVNPGPANEVSIWHTCILNLFTFFSGKELLKKTSGCLFILFDVIVRPRTFLQHVI